MVGAIAIFGFDIGYQRVVEAAHMARRFPYIRVQEYGAVDAIHIVARVNEKPPPEIFYVFLERHAQRTVVEGARQAAVNLRPAIYKTPALRERNYLFH